MTLTRSQIERLCIKHRAAYHTIWQHCIDEGLSSSEGRMYADLEIVRQVEMGKLAGLTSMEERFLLVPQATSMVEALADLSPNPPGAPVKVMPPVCQRLVKPLVLDRRQGSRPRQAPEVYTIRAHGAASLLTDRPTIMASVEIVDPSVPLGPPTQAATIASSPNPSAQPSNVIILPLPIIPSIAVEPPIYSGPAIPQPAERPSFAKPPRPANPHGEFGYWYNGEWHKWSAQDQDDWEGWGGRYNRE